MSSIGGHNFSDFGIIDGQADNSNIAVSGAFDMPVRTGKTHHDWDEEFEPYLRAEEIFFAGRDISYTFLLEAETRELAFANLYQFFDLIGGLTTLNELVIDGIGSFNVYIKNEILVQHIGDGWFKGRIVFREPVVAIESYEVLKSDELPNIDGLAFSSLGLTLLNVSGNLDRPANIEGSVTSYGAEGFKINRKSVRDIKLSILIEQPSIAEFSNALNCLMWVLASPNSKLLKVDEFTRECFAKDGFSVRNIYTEGEAIFGIIDLTLTEIRVLTNYDLLSDEEGSILTIGGVPLSDILTQQ